MPDGQLGSVLREMSARGFKPRPQRGATRSWVGELTCRRDKVRVEVSLSDWDFLAYPKIKVLSGVNVSTLTPHVDAAGGLCYFQSGSIVLNRYEPAAALAQCLDRAAQVLQQIKFDPEYRKAEVQDEFVVHWLADQSAEAMPVMVGTIKTGSRVTNYWQLRREGKFVAALLTDEDDEAAAMAGALRADPPKETTCPCWLFVSEKFPPVPEQMPCTVKELFTWLRSWDPSVYSGVQRVLEREPRYLNYGFASFAVKSPVGWLGFEFDISPYYRKVARTSRDAVRAYRQYLHGKAGTGKLVRSSPMDISPGFVHSRNLTFSDLRDKNIKLVGCGAIGAYVALALVRLGAGTGTGRLTLIDFDLFAPENLGRHVLGYPALFQPKAKALAEELQRQFPLSKIDFISDRVQNVKGLFASDFVIEATGEESVSEMLNYRRIALKARTPMLHVWILGNGEAVQALWAEGVKTACYRCLRVTGNNGELTYRFPVLKHETERRYAGCHAFTPYAVSAPMHAASLVAEMLADWLQQRTASPRFRTRASENADVRKVKNQDVERLASCPACGNAL
jgi:molybdopterin/thiamine biosynthesis adenylyltransferase